MLELYLSELRRFRLGAAIYALGSFLALTLLAQLTEVASAMRELHVMMLFLYMLSGLGFGLYQFGTYRQGSRWIWLMHRPLHRGRILAALALASSTLILLAMALPLFLLAWLQDHYTLRVVDARHYGGAGYLALSTLAAWLAGAYMMLHRSRWAFVVLVLPLLLTMHAANYRTVLLLALSCDALLLLLVYTVFRPNRQTAGDTAATVASALPLQASFYLALLWGGSTLFQVGQMALGLHPLNGDRVPRGGFTETIRMDGRETFGAGLRAARDPRAPGWLAQLKRQDTTIVGPAQRQYAVHDAITTIGRPQLSGDDGVVWTFSHDRMRYRGVNRRTHTALGWLGVDGQGASGAFDAQPFAFPNGQGGFNFISAHDMYVAGGAGGKPRHLLHVGGSEQLAVSMGRLGSRTVLLTNRRILVLEDAAAAGGAGQAVRASFELPLPFGDLARADAARVADGTLVSLIYGERRGEGVEPAPQLVYLVARDGAVSLLARRELGHDFPLLFEHKDWWLSPVLDALVNLPALVVDKGMVPDYGASRFAPLLRARPGAVWLAAIGLALASLLGTLWWMRGARMPARQRIGWCVAAVVLGLPSLLALMVLQPRAARDLATLSAARPPAPGNPGASGTAPAAHAP